MQSPSTFPQTVPGNRRITCLASPNGLRSCALGRTTALLLALWLLPQGVLLAANKAPETPAEKERLIQNITEMNQARKDLEEGQAAKPNPALDYREQTRQKLRDLKPSAKGGNHRIDPIRSNIPKADDSWADFVPWILLSIGIVALLVFARRHFQRARQT